MRLFVGIDLPEVVKDQLLALHSEMPGARWSNAEQMHLTLAFIGETEKNYHPALATVQAQPFTLRIQGLGRFPEAAKAPPRVLWAGLNDSADLHRLQQTVVKALIGTGYTAEPRPFHPHVTLARLKGQTAQNPVVNDFVKRHSDLKTAPIPVRDFVLYSSRLTARGAIYNKEAIYPLT